MPSLIEPTVPNWSTLDSLEGVPEWPQPKETPAERAARGSLLEKGHALFAQLGTLLPGLGLAVGLALAGKVLASWLGTDVLGFSPNPISEISVAIILGLLIRNSIGLPAAYEKGLRLCGKEILRFGIILLGLRLSLIAVFKLGGLALPIILACIVTALVVVTRLNRMLGLPGRLGSLIAVGTSICGVSAIVATAPVIEAEEDEVSYAVACVTLFGLLALFLYPLLAFHLFGEPQQVGLFLGTSIHDTAQVAGAGLMYEKQYQAPEALKTATVVKLVRNLCMVGVIPLVGAWYLRSAQGEHTRSKPKLAQMVPLFVLGFLAMAALRTLGDLGDAAFGFIDRELWKTQFLTGADHLAGWCLTVAMASVGLGTGLGRILKLGAKPFCVGLAAALLVGGVSASLIKLLL